MPDKKKTAVVKGITGQGGSYLSELLAQKSYRGVGILRKTSAIPPPNSHSLRGSIEFVYGDLLDSSSLVEVIRRDQPDELYNLAAQSYPGESWRLPIHTAEITGLGAQRIFEAVRQAKPDCKVYQ